MEYYGDTHAHPNSTQWPANAISQAVAKSPPSERSLPETPYPVIINEAIEVTKTFGGTDGHKFVNGILDKLAAQLRPNDPKRGNV